MTTRTEDPLNPDYWVKYWSNSIRMPWSGAVNQNGWLDWERWFSPVTNITFKGDASLERAIHEQVASYGTQLGVLSEAVLSIANQQGVNTSAVKRLDNLVQQVEDTKTEHRDQKTQKLISALKQTKASNPELYASILSKVDE